MKILVCGSRDYLDYDFVEEVLSSYGSELTGIVHGAARGADTLAGDYGRSANIPVEEYPADWGTHGRAAGHIRNTKMLAEGKPDLVIAFQMNNSKGTQNMINQAKKAGIAVEVYDVS